VAGGIIKLAYCGQEGQRSGLIGVGGPAGQERNNQNQSDKNALFHDACTAADRNQTGELNAAEHPDNKQSRNKSGAIQFILKTRPGKLRLSFFENKSGATSGIFRTPGKDGG
jgi:hypothetical protein